jgi:hypothetical protein
MFVPNKSPFIRVLSFVVPPPLGPLHFSGRFPCEAHRTVQVQECRAETRTRRVQVTNYQTVSEVVTETVPVTTCVAVPVAPAGCSAGCGH